MILYSIFNQSTACSYGCKSCINSSICNQCHSKFALTDKTKQCKECPTNCISCSWNNVESEVECLTCMNDYVVNKQKTCTCE